MERHIYSHFKNDEPFVKSILDYQYRALHHYEVIITNFLDAHKIAIIKKVIGKKNGLKVVCSSGVEGGEYFRVIICRDEYTIEQKDFKITKAKIVYNNKFHSLKHRDVLGALMSLGVKREVFGDILIESDSVYFTCDTTIYSYIAMNLTQISRTKVVVEEVTIPLSKKQEYKTKTYFISSFRLDVMISSLFSVSRSKAKEYILNNFVKVNHKEVEQTDFLCHNNDIISLRKYGRVKILDLHKRTKGNNHIIEGWFYR